MVACAPAHIDAVVAAWDYDGVARSLVLDLKLKGKRDAALELAKGIVDRVWEQGSAAQALVWVPGRRRDIRDRGFDHARLIATAVGSALGIPAVYGLRRTGDRVDQTSLGAQARRANLQGAFCARGVPARVAVVDDLMTTGATLSEAGRALREAGAKRVEGLLACCVA